MSPRHAVMAVMAVFLAWGDATAQVRTQPRQQPQRQEPERQERAPTVMRLYGGEGNRTFLGCLYCGDRDENSVRNPLGEHGNRFGDESIVNRFSPYGDRYSETSACNRYATDPPVVVDSRGRFQGRLSVGRFVPDRFEDPVINGWLEGVCAR